MWSVLKEAHGLRQKFGISDLNSLLLRDYHITYKHCDSCLQGREDYLKNRLGLHKALNTIKSS